MSESRTTIGTIRRTLDLFLEWIVIIAVAALVLDVLWGVFTRFVLDSPSRWTEEFARLLLMWVALLGAAVAFGRREHLGFDYVVAKMDPGAQRLVAVAGECVVILFAVLVMVYGGYVLVAETLTAGQTTPALGIKMGYVYLALPLSGCFVVIYSIDYLTKLVLNDQSDEQQPPEDGDPGKR